MEDMNQRIEKMLAAKTFAVVGASANPEKYGYIAYKTLKAAGKTVYPVNPTAQVIEGDTCYPKIADLPQTPDVVVGVIPPPRTEKLIPQLVEAGIHNLWLQPGAESAAAVEDAEANGIATVHSGPCIMVGLRTHGYLKRPS